MGTNNTKKKITYDFYTLKKKKKGTPSFNTNDSVLKISLPSASNFKTVKIEMGTGKTRIANLNTDILDLNLGAGKNLLEKLEVNTQTKIESGAGLTEILDGTLNNVDLDLGVGKVFINASILGNSKIECGVGATDLDLIGSLDDYKLELEKGIGSIEIGNKTYSSELKKHKLLVKSKLYVIRHYYDANRVSYIFAWLMSRISIIETLIWAKVNKLKA